MRNVTTQLRTVEVLASRRPESVCPESELEDLESHIGSTTVLDDTFVVDDLLRGYSYQVARGGECHYQLTFMLKDGRQLIVAVEPTSDITLVAQKIANRLMESGNRLLHLELGPATEAYRRSVTD